MRYTIRNLREVEDLAAKHGLGDSQEARFPRADLEAESTGVAYLILRPGKRQPFAHRHDEAEEIYVVLAGTGRIKLDDDIIDLRPLDSIRMAPGVTRMLEAGPDGIEVLAFGPRHEGDAEMLQDFWTD
jgi:mannose-6-phosphate isomerase-like protein (cupin superfamily)